ncbi:hypothetical protein BJ508DRAFT_419975 [Ascobolus immersus RN42]|uniref:Nephrocystin 3-like N-terminal domain-containing protein n=1 Tax=Ascobolus immersus RN42 TaxID=1160509 RepID=A0A3N4H9B2_ASCIM|nr:hypothetical protein BJ508DRAFT_419975 [Ascobolus immersus RN42]
MASVISDESRHIVRLLSNPDSGGILTTIDPFLERQLNDIRSRFLLWSGNVGSLAMADASLDQRLRNNPDIAKLVVSMLQSLKEDLERIVNFVSPSTPHIATTRTLAPLVEEEEEDEEQANEVGIDDNGGTKAPHTDTVSEDQEPRSSGTSSSSSDFDFGSSGSDVSGAHPSKFDESPWSRYVESSNTALDHLYRLCSVLRKPASSNENARVKMLISKGNAIDARELDEFKAHIEFHLDFKLKGHKLAPQIRQRLIDAAIFRKIKLIYRERHHQKLAQGTKAETIGHSKSISTGSKTLGSTDSGMAIVSDTEDLQSSCGVHQTDHAVDSPIRKERIGFQKSSTLSNTIASSVNQEGYKQYKSKKAPGSISSTITASAIGRREKLDVPRPPIPSLEGEASVFCPYCSRIVRLAETKGPRWIKHVLKDVEPYVCLFEDCQLADLLFRTPDEWLGHMVQEHNTVWRCRAPGHDHHVYSSEMQLADHLQAAHENAFTPSQLQDFLIRTPLPASEMFSKLSGEWNSDPEKQGVVCRSCQGISGREAIISGDDTEATILYMCILTHLEELALESLPEQNAADDGSSLQCRTVGSFSTMGLHIADNNLDDTTVYETSDSVHAQFYESAPVPDMEDIMSMVYRDVMEQIAKSKFTPALENDAILQHFQSKRVRERDSVSRQGTELSNSEFLQLILTIRSFASSTLSICFGLLGLPNSWKRKMLFVLRDAVSLWKQAKVMLLELRMKAGYGVQSFGAVEKAFVELVLNQETSLSRFVDVIEFLTHLLDFANFSNWTRKDELNYIFDSEFIFAWSTPQLEGLRQSLEYLCSLGTFAERIVNEATTKKSSPAAGPTSAQYVSSSSRSAVEVLDHRNQQAHVHISEGLPHSTTSSVGCEIAMSRLYYDGIDRVWARVGAPHSGTCDWIFHHKEFALWLSDTKNLLWISGESVSGRSTLLKHISSYPDLFRRKHKTGASTISVIRHSFREHDKQDTPHYNSLEGFFRNVLFQIAAASPELFVAGVHAKHMDLHAASWSVQESVSLLFRIANLDHEQSFKSTFRFVLFVDSIDRAAPDPHAGWEMKQLASFLSELAMSGIFKVCVSSQFFESLPTTFANLQGDYACIRIPNGHTSNDMLKYVEHSLSPKFPSSSRESGMTNQDVEWASVSRIIVDHSRGCWPFTKMATAQVSKFTDEGRSFAEILERLEGLCAEYLHFLSVMEREG